MEAIRVLLVDDHPVVREGLAIAIEKDSEFRVSGQAENALEAIAELEKGVPDVIVLDLALPGLSGLDFIKQIKERHPVLPILVLSMYEESVYAERALRAGALGYIMKQEASEKVKLAIKTILGGQVYLSEKMKATLLQRLVDDPSAKSPSTIDHLSDRELEVFQCLGRGLGTRKIAEQLHLSVKTVETHYSNIKRKLNLANSTELMHRAVQWLEKPKTG
jgi:DNA-binding NarL/FixJ family response regulator